MMAMRLIWVAVLCGLTGLTAIATPATGQWEQPASALAEQVAGILGPGQAQLTIRNLSTIPTAEIPAIRKLLEQDLKTHGVLASGAESANSIRVTLSENARERLWLAEVVEGNETRVAIVHAGSGASNLFPVRDGLTLRKQIYLSSAELAGKSMSPIPQPDGPILAAIESHGGLVVLSQDEIVVFSAATTGWREDKRIDLGTRRSSTRDPRGILLPSADGNTFTAFTAGTKCDGSYAAATDNSGRVGDWSVHCSASDDPWTILQGDMPTGPTAIKAFYNAARNYFTGVVTPSLGVDLPPFYSGALLPRPAGGVALLINGVDGKVHLIDNGAMKPVAGARDWGSDFAVLHSGCGAGTQVIASSSGEAVNDSLRAYEVPAQEVIAASAPLAMGGTVTASWSAPGGKSVFAVVRNAANEYEVDRVTALCN